MIVKLLTEHHLEFLSLKGGCRGSSESTHVKMPHCWKSHALAQFFSLFGCLEYTAKSTCLLFFLLIHYSDLKNILSMGYTIRTLVKGA